MALRVSCAGRHNSVDPTIFDGLAGMMALSVNISLARHAASLVLRHA